ncbi:hypothetical protein DS62_13360 [Smithella sp. SC_K08D17]|nr:hypothetical protein KD27_09495 [Smithella sp. D17]KIE18164.1 hypothetical protein DS62_13360 [Smithella sp. SC_K08D17]
MVAHRHRFHKELRYSILLLILSCTVSLLVAEVVARIFFPISDGRDNVTIDGTPVKEWFEPGTVYRQVSNEYDAVTTITDKGHRVPGVDGNPDVIFIGDSFTYGYGLRDDETFSRIYCQQLQLACVNLGMPGSGTLKQVERLEQYITQWHWKPKQVKLFFFGMSGSFSAGNDFVDNYDRYTREHAAQADVQRSGDAQALRAEPTVGLTERIIALQTSVLGHSTLMRLVKYYWGPMLKSLLVADPGNERMATALQATLESLARLDELSRRVGFGYHIYLLVPVQDIIRGTYGETLEKLNSVSPKPVIPTAQLFLDSPQNYYYAFDGHFNAEGSRRVAQFLVSSESGLLIDDRRK